MLEEKVQVADVWAKAIEEAIQEVKVFARLKSKVIDAKKKIGSLEHLVKVERAAHRRKLRGQAPGLIGQG